MKNSPHHIARLIGPARRAFPALVLTLAVALSAAFPAMAWAGYIPTRQAVENDLFLVGDSLVIPENVQGNVFVVGREVRLEGQVDGSLFALADQLTLDGTTAGSVYAVAVTLRQTADSQVEHSLYAASLNLVTERGATIGRDLRAMAVSANLRGGVGRYTQARIGLLELWRALQRGVTGGITGLPFDALPVSLLSFGWAQYALAGLPAAAVSRWAAPAVVIQADQQAVAPWLQSLYGLLALLLVALAAEWLFPVAGKRMVEQARRRPLASIGAGAVVLVNGFLMPALITILVGSAFFGLIFLSVPDLAWMLFGIGFGVVVTAFSLFLLATAYLSKAIVAAMIGGLILQRWLPRYAQVRFAPLLLGLLIYIILASIPYLGLTIGLVATMLGLGAMWLGRRPALPGVVKDAEAALQSLPASEPAGMFARILNKQLLGLDPLTLRHLTEYEHRNPAPVD